MYHIQKFKGIDITLGEKLKQNGIETIEALLEKTAQPEDRMKLAEKIGVPADHILEWASRVDILRIQGMD